MSADLVVRSRSQSSSAQPRFFVPLGEFRSPGLEMGPHQVAEVADLLLGIEFGPKIHEVQEGPQAEADDKMLAVIERQDAAGMLLGEACGQQAAIALGRQAAELQVLLAQLLRVGILLALAIAVGAHRTEIEDLLQRNLAVGSPADAIAGVSHGLHIEAHSYPVGAGLLHHRVREPAHIEHDLGMLQRPVVAPFPGQQAFDADLSGSGLIRPVLAVGGHESLAVVLMHARIDALLRIGGGGDECNFKVDVHLKLSKRHGNLFFAHSIKRRMSLVIVKKVTRQKNIPSGIQNGASTHTHGQAIQPVSLSPRNKIPIKLVVEGNAVLTLLLIIKKCQRHWPERRPRYPV